jgi:hypothetical protein
MPASTRKANKDANFRAYYSKKVPKQIYFPHRRKIVREKPGAARRDVEEPKQLKFLPEMMRRRSTIEDSEGEDEDEDEVQIKEELEAPQEEGRRLGGGFRKRSSDIMRGSGEDEDEDDDPVRPASKRIRQAARKKSRRREPVVSVESPSRDNDTGLTPSASASETEIDDTHKPRLRRQTTMTQLVEGRRPKRGDKEPEFKPVKRSSRPSWGKTKEKLKQRTLTQMVPGLGAVGDSEDEETEDELLEENDAYTNALAEHLNQSGVFEPASRDGNEDNVEFQQGATDVMDDDDDEDEYFPTQDVRPTTIARRQTPRHTSNTIHAPPTTSSPRKGPKSRFSLLATPERRKICEIPSSQSPPESPLSTQNTPAGRRSALRQRSGNTQKPLDTPSKRKKVAFREHVEVAKQQPCSGRKFASFIQDSEDEESENLEEADEGVTEGLDIGAETQNMINGIENAAPGKSIGTETQAILEQIDQACAIAREDDIFREREVSVELGDEGIEPPHFEESQELGEPLDRREHKSPSPEYSNSTYHTSHVTLKQDVHEEHTSRVPPMPSGPLVQVKQPMLPPGDSNQRPTNHMADTSSQNHREDDPPSPVIIKEEHEDDEYGPSTGPLPRLTTTQPPPTCDATDLDGEPIQVRRSPTPPNPETQETNRSFSSRAEHQLQSEWLSFSQYPRPPPSSSMRVIQDISSYQQESPLSHPASIRAIAPPRWSAALSQATTVEPSQRSPNVTPKKSRSRIASTNTTPRKIASSQPIISPQRPATLVIPSSYPSPDKASYGGWSSPLFGRSEGGESVSASVVDFSLPPMPPVVDDEE